MTEEKQNRIYYSKRRCSNCNNYVYYQIKIDPIEKLIYYNCRVCYKQIICNLDPIVEINFWNLLQKYKLKEKNDRERENRN